MSEPRLCRAGCGIEVGDHEILCGDCADDSVITARVIRTDTETLIDLPGNPSDDDESFDIIRDHVGGYLEIIVLPGGGHLYCDEDGIPKRLPVNREASILANRTIVGTAVLVDR